VEQNRQPPNVEEAIRLYEMALKFAEDYGPALNGLVSIYAARLYQPMKALPYAERVVKSQPDSWDGWIRYGGVNLMIAEKFEMRDEVDDAMNYYKTAMDAYEVALKRVPERPDIYPALLAIYQKLGEDSKLERLVDLWQRYAPDDFRRSVESGMAAQRRMDQEGAKP
jgi:tetratricopeptide (TPR) repeat protein